MFLHFFADYYRKLGFIIGAKVLESVFQQEPWYHDWFAGTDEHVWGLRKQDGFFRDLLCKPADFDRVAFRNVAVIVQTECDYF